jgi:ribose transport system permease protein
LRAANGNGRFLLAEAVLFSALLTAWASLSHGLTVADASGFLLALTPLALAAMAQTVPVLAGGQGLAAGATALLVDILLGLAPIAGPGDALLWIALGLLIGGAIGVANGALIGWLRLPSTAVTYATDIAVGALAYALAQEGAGSNPPAALTAILFGAEVFGLPAIPILVLVVAALGGLRFQRSRLAHALHRLGQGAPSAERALPAARLRCIAYGLAGLGYAATGIVLAGQIGAMDSMLGAPVLVQIFAAIALAGSCPGLRGGSISGALLGAAIVTATANLLIPLGVPDILSPALDSAWLLPGLAACAAYRDRAPRHVTAGPLWPHARKLAICGLIVLATLAVARPEAAGVATIAAGLALMTVGQGAVMRLGGFDLAMPAMISLGGMMTVAVSQGSPTRFILAVLATTAIATAVGLWHAFLAPRLGRAIILATLASAGILQAAAVALMVWLPTGFAPLAFTAFAGATWLGIPWPVWILTPCALALAVLLDRHRRRLVFAYGASALSAAWFGILLACIGGSFRLGLVDVYLVPVVAGAVLGGIDFVGGRGTLLAAFGAVLLLQVVDTALVGLGLGYEARLAVMGAIILLRTCCPQLATRCCGSTIARARASSSGP